MITVKVQRLNDMKVILEYQSEIIPMIGDCISHLSFEGTEITCSQIVVARQLMPKSPNVIYIEVRDKNINDINKKEN